MAFLTHNKQVIVAVIITCFIVYTFTVVYLIASLYMSVLPHTIFYYEPSGIQLSFLPAIAVIAFGIPIVICRLFSCITMRLVLLAHALTKLLVLSLVLFAITFLSIDTNFLLFCAGVVFGVAGLACIIIVSILYVGKYAGNKRRRSGVFFLARIIAYIVCFVVVATYIVAPLLMYFFK